MRIAIVGAGRRGIVHGRAAAAYPGVQVVAVCDPDSTRAGQLAAELGARPYAGHRQALVPLMWPGRGKRRSPSWEKARNRNLGGTKSASSKNKMF